MTDEEKITVSKRDWQNLLVSEAILDSLYAMGVDNWSGYDEAMAEYRRRRAAEGDQ